MMNHLVTLKYLPRLTRSIRASRHVAASCNGSLIITRQMSSDTDFKPSEELAKERYDLRSGEDIERKRARLLYQSRKRGMLENGVILASFADKFLNKLDADHLDQYDRLINLPTNDWDIFYWATKTKPTPPEFETPVLEMLRQHLKSKVSSDSTLSDSVLGKSGLDDIVMPSSKKNYDLEFDVHSTDLVNYKQELFDPRERKLAGGQRIQFMTNWRKRLIEHRLKRVVPQPTSLKSLASDKKYKADELYTQEMPCKDIVRSKPYSRDLIESDYERFMKHHDVLQNMLTKDLTCDPLEYDEEAEAWTDMLWHRNYGRDDDLISPTKDLKCNACQSVLHCCDSGLKGYVPREIFVSIGVNDKLKPDGVTCQRCKFSRAYGAKLTHELKPEDYNYFLRRLAQDRSSIFVILIDLTDFPGSIWEDMISLIDGYNKRVLIVGNKMDLLPSDGSKQVNRVKYSLRKNLARLRPGHHNLSIDDLTVISARTGFGVPGLVARILGFSSEEPRNVYIVGSDNCGKSTLFNALLQSDLCATRKGDIISRVSSYQLSGSDVRMLKFPVDRAEGWEVEMKQRKCERVERDQATMERLLQVLTERRQDAMPHMNCLINRLDFLPTPSDGELLPSTETSSGKPNFSDDHPLANAEPDEPMAATEHQFEYNGFCYHTPSATSTGQLHDLLTNDERLEVFPNETIIPRKYSIRPLQSIFIAGLARLDLLTSQSSVIVTIFASKYLPIHVIQTRKADKFYNQFLGSPYLGVPFGDEARLAVWPELLNSEPDFHLVSKSVLQGTADVVLSSAGWAMITMSPDQECLLRAFTPEGRGIFLRNPPLLANAHRSFTGKKIRDTPMFNNPNYKIKSGEIDSIEQ